mgnify:FL=1
MMVRLWMKIVGCRSMYVKNIKEFDLINSIKHLKKMDPDLKRLFDLYRVNNLQPENNYFRSLIRSIIYQQLSGNSARKIFERFNNFFVGNSFPTPEKILSTDIEKLRSTGLSFRKAEYINNIAQAFLDEPEVYLNLEKMDDDEIIDNLTKVKGVGLWTAQMFLMFTLNRPDIFPATDLAMQKGFRIYFSLENLPNSYEMINRSQQWIPYRTTVSLYLWSVLEGPFEW